MFYLKYRPQTIAELDNERIKSSLGKSLLEDNFSHAYLLIGTRGSGKTTTARLIAKIVNCTGREKGEEPCNKCDSCIGVMNGSSLDVIEIDGASNTGVDDIRDLREKVKLAPTLSKFKVYIIDEVHMLSTSAFNALLKTLEEPPKHVIFILATTDHQKLPETIISRCLVYDFGKASKEEIVKSLEKKAKSEKMKIDHSDLLKIADLADGSFRDGDKLLEQVSLGEEISDVKKVAEVAHALIMDPSVQRVRDFVGLGGRVKDLMLAMILELREGMLEKPENIRLIEKLIEANAMVKDSPVPELPLEMLVVEQLGAQEIPHKKTEKITEKTTTEVSDVAPEKWQEIINAVKPFNHNLSALLRSSKPVKLENGMLTIEAFYKFHKDKLSEEKNRKILEEVISGIMQSEIKVKFTLKEGDK